MSVKALTMAFESRVGDPLAKLILIALADHANESFICWPARQTLADYAEVSLDTVDRKLAKLCEMGLVRKAHRMTQSGDQTSNVYQLDFSRGPLLAAPSEGAADSGYPSRCVRLPQPLTAATGPLPCGSNHHITTNITVIEPTPPKGAACDYVIDIDGNAVNADVIMAEWNKLPAPFSKIREMTDKRIKLVKQRLKNINWVNGWREALAIAPNVPFLRGEGARGWVMDFEYFMKPDSVVKIIEGKHGTGTRKSTATVPLRENEVPKVANVSEELRKRGIVINN